MKYIKGIIIVAMILFFLFLIDSNENVDNMNDDTHSTTLRDATILNSNSHADAIRTLNDSFTDTTSETEVSGVGLIYPSFPADIRQFKYIRGDKDSTSISFKGNSYNIPSETVSQDAADSQQEYLIHNPNKMIDISDITDGAWITNDDNENSNAVLSITEDDNNIQSGIDLVYVSGCTQIAGRGEETGQCSDPDLNDIDKCHANNGDGQTCVWDIICEQPHRPDAEKKMVYTPQECIDRGGVVRTDLLQKIKTKGTNGGYVYSILENTVPSYFENIRYFLSSMGDGGNSSDNCNWSGTSDNTGKNYESFFDATCQAPLVSLMGINANSYRYLGSNVDDYLTQTDTGYMRKDNKYYKSADIFKWDFSDTNCKWSSRVSNAEEYNQCSKESTYKDGANTDWEYYRKLKNESYENIETLTDIYGQTSLLNLMQSLKKTYTLFTGSNSSDDSENDTWEPDMKCDTWNLQYPCNSEDPNDNIIGDFRTADTDCCPALNLSDFRKLTNIIKSLPSDHNTSFFGDNNVSITIPVNNLNDLNNNPHNENILKISVEISGFDLQFFPSPETDAQGFSCFTGVPPTNNTVYKYDFTFGIISDEVVLKIESFEGGDNIGTSIITIASVVQGDNESSESESVIHFQIDIDSLLSGIAAELNDNTHVLSFLGLINKLLILKTDNIFSELFKGDYNLSPTYSLALDFHAPVFTVDGLFNKICTLDLDVAGVYPLTVNGTTDDLLFAAAGLAAFGGELAKNTSGLAKITTASWGFGRSTITISKLFNGCDDTTNEIKFTGPSLLKRIVNILDIINHINHGSLPSTPIDICTLDGFTIDDIEHLRSVLIDMNLGIIESSMFANYSEGPITAFFNPLSTRIELDG